MIPDITKHQDVLLTLNTREETLLKNVLPGVDIYPLFLDAENGTWVIRAIFAPGTTLPKHFHTGTVHFYTLAGSWNYVEYPDQPQTAGSYLYEPGGSIHTFEVPADGEGADGFMVVQGANINFDEDGNFINIMDAGWIEQIIIAAAQVQGVKPRYFRPGADAALND
ncbi:2,4'-dihydroxyacetophenone dioxygenase family protein [Halomonas sp. V046]|uniref:2,4'-dihydroxyacetophenone dioxygenase family protein n=1 Tax=Halomonas sp. V046 TaxID=3459611 RepID=UPI004044FCB0